MKPFENIHNNPLDNLTLLKNKRGTSSVEELAQSTGKFSNISLGTDSIDYYLIGTKNLAYDGMITISDSDKIINRGNASTIDKHTIKKGDVVFPYRGRFNSIGVMTSNTEIPYVGHHGLMRISCGEDNLDLAFFIKDYLEQSGVSKTVPKTGITIDYLKTLLIPTKAKELAGYMDSSIELRRAEEFIKKLTLDLMSSKRKIVLNGFAENHDANKDIYEATKEITNDITKDLLLTNDNNFACDDTDFNISLHPRSK